MAELLKCEASSCTYNDHASCRAPSIIINAGTMDSGKSDVYCDTYHYREKVDDYQENNLVEGGNNVAFVTTGITTGGQAAGDISPAILSPQMMVHLGADQVGTPSIDCYAEACEYNKDHSCAAGKVKVANPDSSETKDAACATFTSKKN